MYDERPVITILPARPLHIWRVLLARLRGQHGCFVQAWQVPKYRISNISFLIGAGPELILSKCNSNQGDPQTAVVEGEAGDPDLEKKLSHRQMDLLFLP